MISVIDHAKMANGRPGDDAAYSYGVANNTALTIITRLKTWKVVSIGFDLTIPVAACNICNVNKVQFYFIFFLNSHTKI